MRLLRIAFISLAIGLIAGCITARLYAQSCNAVQQRFRYERRLNSENLPYYVEIFETRQQDCDGTTIFTSSHLETIIPDRPAKVASMNAERQTYVVSANQLQQRINDLNALP